MEEIYINLGIVFGLIFFGYLSGSYLEKRHFDRIEEREQQCADVLVTQLITFPGGVAPELAPRMYASESVIASDYFKSFLSGIRKFFGGEMGSYLPLLERARREAQVRIVEAARKDGYDAVCNLRFENVDIGGATNPRRRAVTVGILASGTAYKRPTA
ncbi:MAG: heavy metal-binding domain-containing protein [Planctomycetota bacterium]